MAQEVIKSDSARGLPRLPGVYRFLDDKGKPLYIGKAKDLRHRVSTWLSQRKGEPTKASRIRLEASRVAFTVTADEEAALVLEAAEIRRHRPPLNIALRDDKSFPYLRVVPDTYPYFALSRTPQSPGTHLGPFGSAKNVRGTIRHLQKTFGVRPCRYNLDSGRIKACVYYRMGQCPAPCEARITPPAYGDLVKGALAFLEGDVSETLQRLRCDMVEAAKERQFEAAARFRNRISALEGFLTQRKGLAPPTVSLDIISLARHKVEAYYAITAIRKGTPFNPLRFPLTNPLGESVEEMVKRILQIHYAKRTPPKTILVPVPKGDWEGLERTLHPRRKTRIRSPYFRWEKERVLEASRDSVIQLDRLLGRENRKVGEWEQKAMEDLDRHLGLGSLPRFIEAFDISNLMGKEAVASKVAFRDGAYDKSLTRNFTMNWTGGANDPAMIAEVIDRRCRGIAEGGEAPDLFLVDGGKTQCAAAQAAVHSWFLSIPVVGLAKRFEKVYGGDPMSEIPFGKRSSGKHLLMRARDESHRVANAHHQKRWGKRTLGKD